MEEIIIKIFKTRKALNNWIKKPILCGCNIVIITMVILFLLLGFTSKTFPRMGSIIIGLMMTLLMFFMLISYSSLDDKVIRKVTKGRYNNYDDLMTTISWHSYFYGGIRLSAAILFFALAMYYSISVYIFYSRPILINYVVNNFIEIIAGIYFIFNFFFFAYHIYINPSNYSHDYINRKIQLYTAVATTANSVFSIFKDGMIISYTTGFILAEYLWIDFLAAEKFNPLEKKKYLKNRRIIIISNNDVEFFKYGANLLKELIKENEVFVVLPYDERVEDLKRMGCKYLNFSLDSGVINPFKHMVLLKRYNDILKENKPDLVITYTLKSNIYSGMVCRFGRVQHVANVTGVGVDFCGDRLRKKLVVLLCKYAFKKSKLVFFENVENRNVFIDNKIINCKKSQVLNASDNVMQGKMDEVFDEKKLVTETIRAIEEAVK